MDRQKTDFRLVLFLVCLLLPASIATGFVSIGFFEGLIIHGTYWILFVIFGLFAGLLLRKAWLNRHRFKNTLIQHRNGMIVVLIAAAFLQVHEPHSFKVLPDEYNIGSSARSMHLYREHAIVDVGYSSESLFTRVTSRMSDSYPLYPWLLSIIHGLTGFRPENAFILNGILGFASCVLVYALVSGWMGTIYGKLSVLLLAGLPIFHESVTGGGGEILEVCLLLSLLWQSRVCLEKGEMCDRVLLIATGYLMACSSVQGSIWSLFPFAVMGFMKDSGSFRQRLIWLSPLLWVYPAAIWILIADPVSIPGISTGIMRLSESMVFLFDTSRAFANSPFLSGVGVVGFVFWLVHLARDRKRPQEPIAHEWLMFGFVAVIGLSALASMVLLSSGWTDPVAAKASIPLYAIVVVLSPYVMRFGFQLARFPKTLLVIPMIAAIAVNGTWNEWGAPSRIKDPESMGLRHLDKALTSKLIRKDALYIGDGASGAILRGWSAMPIGYANLIPERIEIMMRIGFFREFYLGEFVAEGAFGSDAVFPSERFLIEPVIERPIRDALVFRVSRIIGIADSVPGYESDPANLPLPLPEPGESREKALEFMTHLLYEPAVMAGGRRE